MQTVKIIKATFIMSFIVISLGCYAYTPSHIINTIYDNNNIRTDDSLNNKNDKKELQSSNIKYYDIPLSFEIQDHTREICKKYDIDMKDIIAIMKIESNFEHNTKSKNNIGGNYSIGIMQLNNSHIEWYKEITEIDDFDIKNIYHNIEGGASVYRYYINYWEGMDLKNDNIKVRALNSYNMGITGFKNYIKRTGNISRNYDKKVLKYREGELNCHAIINIEGY